MPLAVVCSWLGCQRAPCGTSDCRHPPTVPPNDSRDLSATAFAQPPLGCDVVVHANVEARLAAASLRLTGTVGLCLPVMPRAASSPVSGGLLRDALPNRAQEVVPPQIPVARGFGAGFFEVARQHSCAPVERARTEAFCSRMLLVTTALSHRLQCLRQQPGTLRRQRTTSPPLGTRAPSAAESRAWLRRFRRPRSSRHSYTGFATSAELPTCLHAIRARARSSGRPTFPPRRSKATCRPSTSTNHDDPRAHPWTLATSASGLASHRRPSDPLCGMMTSFEGHPGERISRCTPPRGRAALFKGATNPRRDDRSSRRIYPRLCCLGHLLSPCVARPTGMRWACGVR